MNARDDKLARESSVIATAAKGPAFAILFALSLGHLLNDLVQSVLPAIYPLLKEELKLDFGQIGLITLAFQLTASLLQPAVGIYTDRTPKPFSLPVGMAFSMAGLVLVASAHSYFMVLIAAALIGSGSSIFHPESSRVARLASGGRYGFAQSVFQVGGNVGHAVGPLLVALIVVPNGQQSIVWFAGFTLAGMALLGWVGVWYRNHLAARRAVAVHRMATPASLIGRRRVVVALAVLLALVFSKNFYLASLGSYYTFYLIDRFSLSVQESQLFLFLFLASAAAGTLAGGAIGDRLGHIPIMWLSILGVLPFSLALPYVNLPATVALTVIIGFVMASAFPAIIVYAQELVPGRVGAIGGLFFGFAFGMGGLGAALLGQLADVTSIGFVFKVCAFLPAIGIVTALLPKLDRLAPAAAATPGAGR
jgi:FSR family fosmidomycin resistance protein-like MFS transporter